MKTSVNVKYFNIFREITGVKNEEISFSGENDLKGLTEELCRRYGPGLKKVLLGGEGRLASHIRVFINNELVIKDNPLIPDGAEIAFFLAVVGG